MLKPLITTALLIAIFPIVSADDQCEHACAQQQSDDIRACLFSFVDNVHSCNDDRKAAREDCKSLSGRERGQCNREAAKESQSCKRDGRDVLSACLDAAIQDGLACKAQCDDPQPPQQGTKDIIINEIMPDADPGVALIELYVSEGVEDPFDMHDFVLSTEDGDMHPLPAIAGLEQYDHVAIFYGDGQNDTDATDGNATIYLGSTTSPLDPADEVFLYDSFGNTVDFVRYGGGNGDGVAAGWSNADPGKTPVAGQSLQLHGPDLDDSSNWLSNPPSPANPNIFQFDIGSNHSIPYQIHNGQNFPVFHGPDSPRRPGYDIHQESGPFTPAELEAIQEILNFTYEYLKDRGFGEPHTGGDGDVDVHVTRSRSNSGSGGDANQGTRMNVDVLNFTSFANNVTNKATIEHEHTHIFQFEESGGWGPVSDWGDIEGHAEYWSTEISMAQFGITYAEYLTIYRSKYGTGPEGWLKDTDRPIYTDFKVEWDYYWGNHILYRCIAELYNQSVVKEMHAVRNVTTGTTGIETINEAFRRMGINKTFEDVIKEVAIWQHLQYPGLIGFTTNDTFSGSSIEHSETLSEWGTDYEFVSNASEGFNVEFDGNGMYWITVIKTFPNGTTVTETIKVNNSALYRVEPGYTDVTIIKTQIDGPDNNPYNFSVSPLPPRRPTFVLDGMRSVFSPQGNGSVELSVTPISPRLDKTIYDLEIFFDEQPIVLSATIDEIPPGWESQVFDGGMLLYTNEKPFPSGQAINFSFTLSSNGTPQFLIVHATNRSHRPIGSFASQNINGSLSRIPLPCPESSGCDKSNNITIQTEIVCMDLTGGTPIGPIHIRNSSLLGSINFTLDSSFFDKWNITNPDNVSFTIPDTGLGCMLTDPVGPWDTIVVRDDNVVIPPGQTVEIPIEMVQLCLTSVEPICIPDGIPICGNNIVEPGEQCDPPGFLNSFPGPGEFCPVIELFCDETCQIQERCLFDDIIVT